MSKNHPLADVVMEVKRAASKWLKTNGPEFARFHWQAGYGAFSIGQSALDDTIAYIAHQPEHHRKRTFEEEFRALMKLYQLELDERYVWN